MSCLVEGYNYDIFISYRHKDNNHDSWVSEFVENLKGELESAFKEEIGVYFDVNPHDGLLETHDVEESLKEKLRCLIFIPILSRTYCDPKSFAWEHEFKAFVNSSSNDRFGLKVKLPNGNIASRVLPIRIHDLECEDIKLFEGMTGGIIRTLDFIFRTNSGVNRPLKLKEDHPNDNLNKTYYSDQINKVALAIREIVTAMRQFKPRGDKVTDTFSEPQNKETNRKKTGVIISSILAIIIFGVIIISKLLSEEVEPGKSIAVLPFRNDSTDPENESFCNGLMEEILDNLVKIGSLEVKSRTDVERFRGTTKSIKEIAGELSVENILEGSVRKQGNRFRLSVQLINAKTGNHLWSQPFEGPYSDTIWTVTSNIAKNIASSLNVVISNDEKEKIGTFPTTNIQAYDYYSRGRYEARLYWNDHNKKHLFEAQKLFDKALELDPKFEKALYEKFGTLLGLGDYDSYILYANELLRINPTSGDAYYRKGEVYRMTHVPDSAIQNYILAVKYLKPGSDKAKISQFWIGAVYCIDKSDYINGLKWITKGFNYNKENASGNYYNTALLFWSIGDYEKAERYFRKSIEYEVTLVNITSLYSMLITQSKYKEALTVLDNYFNQPERIVEGYHGRFVTYFFLKDFVKSEQYFSQFLGAGGTSTLRDSILISYVYLHTGREQIVPAMLENCRKTLEKSLIKTQNWNIYLNLSMIHAILNNTDAVRKYLSKAVDLNLQLGSHDILTSTPIFEYLKDDSEFNAIVKRAQDEKAVMRAQVDEMTRRGEWTLE